MDQTILLLGFVAVMGGFMWWSQRRSKKNYEKKMEALQEGTYVVTIGGIYGTLTVLDREANRARLEIAPNVEIEVKLNAISGQVDVGAAGEA